MKPKCNNPKCKWYSEKTTDYCSFECRVMAEKEQYNKDMQEMAKAVIQ